MGVVSPFLVSTTSETKVEDPGEGREDVAGDNVEETGEALGRWVNFRGGVLETESGETWGTTMGVGLGRRPVREPGKAGFQREITAETGAHTVDIMTDDPPR